MESSDREAIDYSIYGYIKYNNGADQSQDIAITIANLHLAQNSQQWQDLGDILREQHMLLAAGAAYAEACKLLPYAKDRAAIVAKWAEMEWQGGKIEQATARRRTLERLLGRCADERSMELETEEGYVLCRRNAPMTFDGILADSGFDPLDHDHLMERNSPKLSGIDMTLYEGVTEDCSFLVMAENNPLLLAVCDVVGDGQMKCGQEAVVLIALTESIPDWAERLAISQLRHLARWSGASMVVFDNDGSSATQDWLKDSPHFSYTIAHCAIDLSQPMDAIRRDYRETHRQQVAWGRKNLRVEIIEHPASLYQPLCQLYRDGSKLIPEFTEKSLDQPGIRMLAAWMGDSLASVVVLTDCGRSTYYAAGARMGGSPKPLTHVLIDAAIEDAKARGQEKFSFGVIPRDASASAKLRGIAGFKQGFGPAIRPRQWVTIAP